MTKILSLDASTDACSVAISVDGEVQELFEVAPRGHTQLLLPMVEQLLSQAQIKLADLDAIAYGRGPGSFTGLRIAAGVVQGLAFGANLPVVPISTLAAMAQGVFRESDTTGQSLYCLCVLDAHMGEVYSALYSLWDGHLSMKMLENVNTPEALVLPPDLMPDADLLIVGDGAKLLFEKSQSLFNNSTQTLSAQKAPVKRRIKLLPELRPHAQDICLLAAKAFEREDTVTAEEAIPVYIRDKTTWKKRHEQ